MLHGEKAAKESEKMAVSTFKNDSSGENLPNIKINKEILNKNIVELASYVTKEISKSEIRRLIKSNGIKINNQLVNDEKFIINTIIIFRKRIYKIINRKKKHFKNTLINFFLIYPEF